MLYVFMALDKQKFREIVFQLLYSDDFSKAEDTDMLPFLMAQLAVTKKSLREAQEKMKKILEKRDALDEKIRNSSLDYSFERITGIERNILRLGLYEILHDDDVPEKVAISEGIR